MGHSAITVRQHECRTITDWFAHVHPVLFAPRDHKLHGPQNIWLTCAAALWGDPVKPKAVDDAKLPAWAEFDWVKFYVK